MQVGLRGLVCCVLFLSWICFRWFFTVYHGKSPFTTIWENMFFLFQAWNKQIQVVVYGHAMFVFIEIQNLMDVFCASKKKSIWAMVTKPLYWGWSSHFKKGNPYNVGFLNPYGLGLMSSHPLLIWKCHGSWTTLANMKSFKCCSDILRMFGWNPTNVWFPIVTWNKKILLSYLMCVLAILGVYFEASSKVVSTHLWNTPLNLYQQAIRDCRLGVPWVCLAIFLEFSRWP